MNADSDSGTGIGQYLSLFLSPLPENLAIKDETLPKTEKLEL